MHHYVKLFFLILATLVIASCSTLYGSGVIQNRGTDYLKANSIPPLKIPPGLSSSSIDELYPVSDRDYPESSKEVNLKPPGL